MCLCRATNSSMWTSYDLGAKVSIKISLWQQSQPLALNFTCNDKITTMMKSMFKFQVNLQQLNDKESEADLIHPR